MILEVACCVVLFTEIVTANQYNPKPNPDSVVIANKARFTVLTPRLIRMEWGQTVDAATFTFINRNLVKPSFTVKRDDKWVFIETDYIKVKMIA